MFSKPNRSLSRVQKNSLRLTATIKTWIRQYISTTQDLDGGEIFQQGLFRFLNEKNSRITYADVQRWAKAHRWITDLVIELMSVDGGGTPLENERVIGENEPGNLPQSPQYVIVDGMQYQGRRIIEQGEENQEHFQNISVGGHGGAFRHVDNISRSRINVQGEQVIPPIAPTFNPHQHSFQQTYYRPQGIQQQVPRPQNINNSSPNVSDSGISGTASENDIIQETSSASNQTTLKECFKRLKRLQDYTDSLHGYNCLRKLERKGIKLLSKSFGFQRNQCEYRALRQIKQEYYNNLTFTR